MMVKRDAKYSVGLLVSILILASATFGFFYSAKRTPEMAQSNCQAIKKNTKSIQQLAISTTALSTNIQSIQGRLARDDEQFKAIDSKLSAIQEGMKRDKVDIILAIKGEK